MKTFIALTAAIAVCVLSVGASAGDATGDVTCPKDTQTFSGTAANLIVPEDGFCAISDARIARDLVLEQGAGADVLRTSIGRDAVLGEEAGTSMLDTTVGRDLVLAGPGEAELGAVTLGRDLRSGPASSLHLERTRIGRDLAASRPSTVQTGQNGPHTPGGAVSIGHDVLVSGSPEDEDFVFDGLCALEVGHDLSVTNRAVTLGIGLRTLRDTCAANTIGHDLVFTGNTALPGFFGPSTLRVGDNRVGHDLVVADNTAVDGGSIEVTGNVVGHDAVCSGNTPAPLVLVPNVAGHANGCG